MLVQQFQVFLDESAKHISDFALNDSGSGQKLPSLLCPAKHNK